MVQLGFINKVIARTFASMRVLNVAEKNEAAKNIAAILGRGRTTRREGYSKFNKIYEFPIFFNGVNCSFIMTSVSGHLLNYEFSQCFRSWESCNPLVLFDAPIEKKVVADSELIRRTLEREIKNCSHLILWTDCDREGENIGMEIAEVCRRVKPSIQVSRAKFSEITPAAINRAVNNLTTPDERVSQAVDARQELDLRIGAAFTRFQTLRLKRVFPRALADQLISYGSCQFPTLGFVVERFREVENFVPEPFWKIQVEVLRNEGQAHAVFQWKRGRLFDRDCCAAYHEHLLENPTGRIVLVQQKPKNKWRPLPLDTVEMEKLASRKLRIGAKETMQLAESLYTKGFISYPRTETNSFPPELKLQPLVEALTQDSRWSDFAQRLLTNGLRPRNGKKSDQAHPPIHPLKAGSSLQGNEARLYELITRHFLACLSEDAKGAETTVRLLLGLDSQEAATGGLEMGELFEAKGLVIYARNYLEIYPYETWSEKFMPNFTLNEVITPDKIEMIEGRTTAPNLLTEADLIALMDRYGIGTDATHAEHIETIKKRMYVGLQDSKFLVPSQLGMGLVEGYDSMDLAVAKPCLRAELEEDLKAICEGRKRKEDVLQIQLAKYKSAFEMVVREARKLDAAIAKHLAQEAEDVSETSLLTATQGGRSEVYQKLCECPNCSKDVIIRQRTPQDSNLSIGSTTQPSTVNRTRWFFSCTGFPGCKFAIWLPDVVVAVRIIDAGSGVNPAVSCSSIDGDGCRGCGRLVGLKFRLRTVIPNGYVQETNDMEYVTCLFCDEEFRQAYGIRFATQNTFSTAATVSTSNPVPRRVSPIQPLIPQQPPNRSFSTFVSSTQVLNQQRASFGLSPVGSLGNQDSGIDNGNPIVCSCGVPARLLTVRKEGPNKGKQFYRCGEVNDACNFFLWKDASTGNSTGNPSFQSDSGFGSSTGDVVCTCGLPAVKKTVSQATANQGRQFFVCPNSAPGGGGSGCRFFQWADAPSMQVATWNRGGRGSRTNFLGGRGGGGGSGGGQSLDGFADSENLWPPPNPRGGRSGFRRARGSGGGASGGVRKCSRCHLPGHTRNRCPNAPQE